MHIYVHTSRPLFIIERNGSVFSFQQKESMCLHPNIYKLSLKKAAYIPTPNHDATVSVHCFELCNSVSMIDVYKQ